MSQPVTYPHPAEWNALSKAWTLALAGLLNLEARASTWSEKLSPPLPFSERIGRGLTIFNACNDLPAHIFDHALELGLVTQAELDAAGLDQLGAAHEP